MKRSVSRPSNVHNAEQDGAASNLDMCPMPVGDLMVIGIPIQDTLEGE